MPGPHPRSPVSVRKPGKPVYVFRLLRFFHCLTLVLRYTFVCCMLPMAPPVSVKTGPLDAGGAWEGGPLHEPIVALARTAEVFCFACPGTYCPAGRSEGRATLMRGKASSPYFSKRALVGPA